MKFLIFFLCCLLFIGCEMKSTTQMAAVSPTHKNGLQVSIAVQYSSIEETPNGFVIYIQPADARQQNYILVEKGVSKPEGLSLSKVIDDKEYFYLQETYEGGSGGAEKILKIWKSDNGSEGYFIEHYNQSDFDEGSNTAWDIAVSAESI